MKPNLRVVGMIVCAIGLIIQFYVTIQSFVVYSQPNIVLPIWTSFIGLVVIVVGVFLILKHNRRFGIKNRILLRPAISTSELVKFPEYVKNVLRSFLF